nr:glycosyltransferase family A protein [uncultured Sediminibacterium sp.]
MDQTNPLVSVVIPCYNHGAYIQEALDSIEIDKINYPVEIIIVDDGSTDQPTLQKLEALKTAGYQVIFQTNGGPASARNTGVKASKGTYILPLDADNKITPDYINKAIPILTEKAVDIVYARPIFFGDLSQRKRQYKVRKYDDLNIVTGNFADACAVYKKTVWEKNGGYDTYIPFYGFEDWEFWINAASNGFHFYFLDEKLFYYRIVANSVITGYNQEERITLNKQYIAKKHSDFYLQKLIRLSYIKERYEVDIMRFIITPILYPLYLLKIIDSPIARSRKKFR